MKNFTLIAAFVALSCPIWAQPWQHLLNSSDPNDNNLPDYKRLMLDANASWYDIETAWQRHWVAMSEKNGATQNEETHEALVNEYYRVIDFLQKNCDEHGRYLPQERSEKFWDALAL